MLKNIENGMERFIFWSRWLQAPVYLGLIVAQILYCYKFAKEVIHLVMMTESSTETQFLLVVLTLVDIAMVANLITMVVIGGYATFVSKLDIKDSDDRPEWLDHIDPGSIKVKLASSLVGISSIHLLKSFINVGDPEHALSGHGVPVSHTDIMWQVIIHMTFVVSALLMAFSEYIMHRRYPPSAADPHRTPGRNS